MTSRFAIAAAFAGASLFLAGASVTAQGSQSGQPAAPPMPTILAGKKFTPPIKGTADVDYVKSPTRREGTTLVTKIQVKNTSTAPIPRLRIDETWYDKSGATIPGGEAVINGLLQPGEVQTVEIRTPVNSSMASQTFMFSHANGQVKPHAVKSLDAPNEAATKTSGKSGKTSASKKK